jgi:pimeloyl-ACP methyl ester carboxylesterase
VQVLAQARTERSQSCLGGGVGRHAGPDELAVDRRHQDHVALAPGQHPGQQGVHEGDGRPQVHVDQAIAAHGRAFRKTQEFDPFRRSDPDLLSRLRGGTWPPEEGVSHMPQPTIVLVHGAWADGSSWNPVSVALQGEGFDVLTPPNLLHGVAGDSAYVASFLSQRTTGPVVLVGHSYGGVVITNAGAKGGDVKALVYVNAFIPDEGESVFDILGGTGSALDVPDPTTVLDLAGYPDAPEGDVEAFLKASTVHESFAQDLPEADRNLIVASQRPIALGANIGQTEAPAWKSIPSWAVLGTEDKVIPIGALRSMAERAGATISEVPGSHVSMVSNPDATIAAIKAAVASADA